MPFFGKFIARRLFANCVYVRVYMLYIAVWLTSMRSGEFSREGVFLVLFGGWKRG